MYSNNIDSKWRKVGKRNISGRSMGEYNQNALHGILKGYTFYISWGREKKKFDLQFLFEDRTHKAIVTRARYSPDRTG